MNIALLNDDLIVAMELSNQPRLSDLEVKAKTIEEMEELDSLFDLALLERTQVMASSIKELNEALIGCGLPDFPVIFCNLDYAKGCVFTDGDVPWSLVFMDAVKAKSERDFQETYVHEAAHLFADDYDHDFSFAVIHNLFRQAVGWDKSASDVDYRGCLREGFSIEQAQQLSALFVNACINSRLPLQAAASALLSFVKVNRVQGKTWTVELLEKHLEAYRSQMTGAG